MSKPLAERLRPKTLDEYIGQSHLVGPNGIVRRMIETGRLSSMILWGPPGVGKTTLAQIIARSMQVPFYTLSAVNCGVKEVRDVIERAQAMREGVFRSAAPVLFIDEIHRFSKSQQDSLLAAVETGVLTLVGATTENPSFEIIRPLLSRCQVYMLQSFGRDELMRLAERALTEDEEFRERRMTLDESESLLRYSGGDARKLLNILELVANSSAPDAPVHLTNRLVEECLQRSPLAYDKGGEMHYDIISAYIKSLRGSDPDAALYWLARMIEGGEEPTFIARRLLIAAAEDVGLANPNALLMANAAFDAVTKLGWPEARIPLAEATVYVATSPKSNSAYQAIGAAMECVRRTGNLPVPLHLRNAPTRLMEELGYGADYKYAHDYDGHFVRQQYLPDGLADGGAFWTPQPNPHEAAMAQRMAQLWGARYAGNPPAEAKENS